MLMEYEDMEYLVPMAMLLGIWKIKNKTNFGSHISIYTNMHKTHDKFISIHAN